MFYSFFSLIEVLQHEISGYKSRGLQSPLLGLLSIRRVLMAVIWSGEDKIVVLVLMAGNDPLQCVGFHRDSNPGFNLRFYSSGFWANLFVLN